MVIAGELSEVWVFRCCVFCCFELEIVFVIVIAVGLIVAFFCVIVSAL